MNSIVFPFVAIVGQEEIKNALMWNIINPQIGGVLISGEKGTAKSSLARGVCCLCADICTVELPLNTTEDRLLGNIDFEYAVKYGKKRIESGILKKADGNLLYVDEVNLLSDHLVKSLLEVASSGENIIEREGLSARHASKFILVGSMNPEEGGLRSQFLDRFGLYVEVKGEADHRVRAEIIKRRIEFERDPIAFGEKWQEETKDLADGIQRAKKALNEIEVSQNAMELAATISREANCAGHRGELVMIETAKAIAAMDLRKTINVNDIKEAANYALPHRVREKNEPPPPDQEEQDQEPDDQQEEQNQEPEDRQDEESSEHPQQEELESNSESLPDDFSSEMGDQEEEESQQGSSETIDLPDELFQISGWLSDSDKKIISRGSGKRSLMVTSSLQGRYVRSRIPIKGELRDIALDATLRTAAPYQKNRDKKGMAVAIEKSDIRVKIREKRTGNTIIFVVDASGSMGANKRMKAVKGAILSLLNDAYQKRDKVAMIAFKNHTAELILGVTRSVELAEKQLTLLPTGGRTPLAAGLNMAYDLVKAGKIKDKDMLPVIVLISDGRATYSETGIDPFTDALNAAKRIRADKIKTIVIDTDQNFIKLHLAEQLAEQLDADRFEIEELQAMSLVAAIGLSV